MEEQKGMELHGILKFCMNFHAWMVRSLSLNLGFHPNPKIMESKVGKTLNSLIRIWNPPFEVGFMV